MGHELEMDSIATAVNFSTWANGTVVLSHGAGDACAPCAPCSAETLLPRSTRRILQDAGYVLPSWPDFFDMYLFWPLIFQLIVTAMFIPMQSIYSRLYFRKGSPFRKFVDKWIGTVDKPQVERPAFIVLCYIFQLVFSSISVMIFVIRTYTKEVTPGTQVAETIFSLFFLFHYFVLRMQAGFHPGSAWILGAFIDNLTMIPVLFGRDRFGHPIDKEKTWLSLKFLRAYRALLAYIRLEKTIDLQGVSELNRKLFLSFLRCMALVICYSGTIMVVEILGEIPGWEDDEMAIETNMGNLTFMQMFYWMVTTISTVGYGDFSPTTVPGRVLICGFIVGGIIFFGNETTTLGEIYSSVSLGKGKYTPKNRKDEHVVVVGSGCNKCSSQMTTFLEEILDVERGAKIPNVVLLSEENFDEELLDYVKSSLPKRVQSNVIFLNGNVMVKRDLVRCNLTKCTMAFIIPDISVSDCSAEDGQNILRAMEMKRFHPKIKLRLMLLQPESKTRAMKIGIKMERCFAAHEVKANLIVQSLRCKGFMTILAGLVQCVSPFEIQQIEANLKQIDKEWMQEYFWGLQWTVHGLVLAEEFIGMSFAQACSQIFQRSQGYVLLLGVQFRGKLIINFDGDIEADQVGICITNSKRKLKEFSHPNMDWRRELIKNRQAKFDSPFTETEDSNASYELAGTKRHRTQGFQSAYYSAATQLGSPVGAQLAQNVDFERMKTAASEVLLSEQEEAQEMRKNPNLITLFVIGNSSWQEVVAFLRTLRQPFLPVQQPVIILSTQTPPEDLVQAFETEKVAFLTGPLLSVNNMIEAGLKEAQSVIIMRGDASGTVASAAEAIFADHETVLMSSMIREMVAYSNLDQFTITEFQTTTSVHLVDQQDKARQSGSSSHSTLGTSSFMDEGGNSKSFMDHGSSSMIFAQRKPNGAKAAVGLVKDAIKEVVNVVKQLFTKGMEEGDDGVVEAITSQLIFHPSFAAGNAFTPDFFGGLLGHIYHFPAAVEFTEAVTMPGRRNQTSFPFQIKVPSEWVGKTYGEIANAWITGADPRIEGCGSVLIIAMYRRRKLADQPIGTSGYNVTLPALDTTLKSDDLLTVLAPKAFGQIMAKLQLLRGAMMVGNGDGTETGNTAIPETLSERNPMPVISAKDVEVTTQEEQMPLHSEIDL